MEYWIRNFRFQILDFRLKIQFEICNLKSITPSFQFSTFVWWAVLDSNQRLSA